MGAVAEKRVVGEGGLGDDVVQNLAGSVALEILDVDRAALVTKAGKDLCESELRTHVLGFLVC